MDNKKSVILAGIEAVHAILLILVIKVFAPVCTGMVKTMTGKEIPMKCHYTSQVLILLGVILLVNAIVLAVKKEAFTNGIILIAISIVAILVLNPTLGIGVCKSPEMACNLTAPIVKVVGGVGVVIGLISSYFGIKNTK